MRLPPHNQRRLSAKLAELYPGRYEDWYAYTRELQLKGCTYEQIAAEICKLGIDISQFAVRNWMLERKRTAKAA
jgi:hypothetical protein